MDELVVTVMKGWRLGRAIKGFLTSLPIGCTPGGCGEAALVAFCGKGPSGQAEIKAEGGPQRRTVTEFICWV